MDREIGFSKFTIRVPNDVKAWLAVQVSKNASSFGSEMIRCCRERMERFQANHITTPKDT